MTLRLLLALCLYMVGTTQAGWKEWEHDSDKIMYISTEVTKHKDSIIIFWMLIDYKKPQMRTGQKVMSSMARNVADCLNGWLKVTSLTTYSESMGSGKEVASSIVPMEWQPVLPGTGGSAYLDYVCGQ